MPTTLCRLKLGTNRERKAPSLERYELLLGLCSAMCIYVTMSRQYCVVHQITLAKMNNNIIYIVSTRMMVVRYKCYKVLESACICGLPKN